MSPVWFVSMQKDEENLSLDITHKYISSNLMLLNNILHKDGFGNQFHTDMNLVKKLKATGLDCILSLLSN